MHARALVFLLLLSAAAGAANAEVLDASPSGFTVRNVETVPAEPGVAWSALVDDIDRWWPKDHSWWGAESRLTIEPRAGGCFCERAGGREAAHMTVAFVDPGRTLRMLGGLGPLQGMGLYGALEFTLEPVDGGTRITLRYRAGGYSPDDLGRFASVVDRVQGQQLGALADHLRERADPR